MAIDLETIRSDAKKATQEFLKTRNASSWKKLSPTLYVKRDGGGLNVWVRGDHAGGEGLFFLPEYELPALATIFEGLAEEHLKNFAAQYVSHPEARADAVARDAKQQRLMENPGKQKTVG